MGLRQHAVIGGEGPPLLLVHGWPENWYAWRKVMPALARDYEVIAVDQRGIGRSDKPAGGYDTGTLADDLVALMDALGHRRFAVVGHDTGHFISYALAADHPDRVARVALLEVPGPPGATPSPPLFIPEPINNKVWHIPFNRVDKVPEQLIRGREDIYFGYEFAIQAGKKLPEDVVDYYVRLVSNRKSLRGSLVQMTPPASNASIIFGKGVTSDPPGSIGSMLLAVDDIEAARDELVSHGVDVELFHDAGGSLGGGFIADKASRAPGPDPERRSYASYASFSDPDGNGWLLQEITERLPGRV